MTNTSINIAGIILAGGLSRRMGGIEKSQLKLAGNSLLHHVICKAKPQVDTLLLNANGDPGRFSTYNLPIIADVIPEYAGPLAGILTGMEWLQTNQPECQWLVSFAVDTPFFPSDLVSRLVDETNTQLSCASSNNRIHPIFGLWPVSMAKELRNAMINHNMRKISAWMQQQGCIYINWDTTTGDPFFNINKPIDLQTAQQFLINNTDSTLKLHNH